MSHRRLGRGLDSLISASPDALPPQPSPGPTPRPENPAAVAEPEPSAALVGLPVEIPVDRLRPNPFQPRKDFDDAQLRDLMQSISSNGIIQPIVVRRAPDETFELVTGERRLRAVIALGWKAIPAVVKEVPDDRLLELALIENIQREDLNPIEKAEAFRDFISRYQLTQEDAAKRIGVDRATLANHLRLLDLGLDVQVLVRKGALSMGHARTIAAVGNSGDQLSIATQAIRKGWSVRETERAVARLLGGKRLARIPSVGKSPQIALVERQLSQIFGTKVRIEEGPRKGSGRIIVEYYNIDDIDRILSVLRR